MKFVNASENRIEILLGAKRFFLEPTQTFECEAGGEVNILLRHTYKSTALSEKEIIKDNNGFQNEFKTVADFVKGSDKPPYFNIVTDSKYTLNCPNTALVRIVSQKIRPNCFSAYDRLYPLVSQGNVTEISHEFAEKEEFKQLYKKAAMHGKRKLVNIGALLCSLLALPLFAFLIWANLIFGIVLTVLGVIALCAVFGILHLLIGVLSKGNLSSVFSDFESKQISKYYAEADKHK